MSTPHFLGPLILEDRGGLPFVLHAPLSYVTAADALITVPAGFVTDLASIPRPLWAVLPPLGKYDAAAVLHDQAYQTGRIHDRACSRAAADALLLEAMTARGVRWSQRRAIYYGVRAGGWAVWRRYRAAAASAAATSPA